MEALYESYYEMIKDDVSIDTKTLLTLLKHFAIIEKALEECEKKERFE